MSAEVRAYWLHVLETADICDDFRDMINMMLSLDKEDK